MNEATFDIETYNNIFTCVFYIEKKDLWKTFEVSERRNDFEAFKDFIFRLKEKDYYMVGFNNMSFDYPVIHELLKLPSGSSWQKVTKLAKDKCEQCINTDFHNKNAYVIWEKNQVVKQIDLMRVWHFDRKGTSLKMLQFVMRLPDIQELPFDPDKDVRLEDMDALIEYNKHDVEVTHIFRKKTEKMLSLRQEIGEEYGIKCLNDSNTAMGQKILVKELERTIRKDICYYFEDGERYTRQTPRPYIDLKECILPYIKFESEQFKLIQQFFEKKTIFETKGVFTELSGKEIGDELLKHLGDIKKVKGNYKSLNVLFNDLTYVFGLGGLHASVSGETFHTNDDFEIKDVDVAAFYPSLAIQNKYYAEHLGPEYCPAFEGILIKRKQHPKGTGLNVALKEAANASYGNSNQEFSPLYDPKYTMTTTISGQLSLCMLAEAVCKIVGLRVIQANTDGITCYVPKTKTNEFDNICKQWEDYTKLTLEYATYKSMYIRDVNNYMAVYENGGVKRIGAYQWDLLQPFNEMWHKDHSALVVPKAAEAYLIEGKCYKDYIRNHDDKFDFFYRTKITGKDRLVSLDITGDEVEQQNITRYYIGLQGDPLVKIAPPRANKKITDKIRTAWGRILKSKGVTKTIVEGKNMIFTEIQEQKINRFMAEAKSFDIDDITSREIPEKLRPIIVEAISHCQPSDARTSIQAGKYCMVANTIDKNFTLRDIDYSHYEAEVEKLIKAVK